ncbi:MAG: PQQ-binding-like beta-propeller repeat protein, partial [Actinomycetota bacterium]|nr:PQQ-binding-like beta-propeller repeat protein [Actinomycetota bacterium]
TPSTTTAPTTTTTTTVPAARFADGRDVSQPYGSVDGITMFRGNLTRSWYGTGPVPTQPEILWRYPDTRMCGASTHKGEPKTWCGTGWTGQPVIWERPDGVTELIFGSYDKAVHFVDARTGQGTRPKFVTGDIVKGSVALDPDGFPLLYFGSRDNEYRILALDRESPTELWSRNAYENRVVWNDDWDGNPAIADDLMFLPAESGWFLTFRLNRSYDSDGLVGVDPEVLLEFPVFTDELLAAVGREQSVENSPAVFGDTVFFANSGGRIVGLDIADIEAGAPGEPVPMLDYWVGEDVDASIVIDAHGMLYVAVEQERFNDRGKEVGQLLKLDPARPDDPPIWSIDVPPRGGGDGGLWATPALGQGTSEGMLYAATHPGEILAVDTATGEVTWRDEIGWHAWSSPIVVDETLVVAADCNTGGTLRGYDLADPKAPTLQWEAPLQTGCIESSPIMWDGHIYVGSRDGFMYSFGDRSSIPSR